MATTKTQKIENSNDNSEEQDMKTYGIERVPVDYFHYQAFRYTNAKDAIAQAKRDDASSTSRADHDNRASGI